MAETSTPAPSTLRRDSFRPRTASTASTTTLLTALNLLVIALAALKKTGENPSHATTPARAATIQRVVDFIRDAWTEETFHAELAKAEARLPVHGGVEAAGTFVGLWVSEAVRVLDEGGLERDAEDLREIAGGLSGPGARATGEGRVESEGQDRR